MATKQDVINRVTLILSSKATQQIDFQLDGIHVVGSSLGIIIGYVTFKQLGWVGVDVDFGNVPPDAGAAYDPSSNTFHFKDTNFGQTDSDGEDTVHESVHAWLDIRMPRVRTIMDMAMRFVLTTSAVTDEAAAYVAGALYYLYQTTGAGAKAAKPSWATKGTTFNAAYDIALKIMKKPGTVVAAADVKAMKAAVLASKSYTALKNNPAMTYGNDGV